MAKDIASDEEFEKHISANKFVLAIFMESDTEMEVGEILIVVKVFLMTIIGKYPWLGKDVEECELY